MDKQKFSEYLACHGSDVKAWPEELRFTGQRALQIPEFAMLVEQEKRFERLLGEDRIDMPAHLAQHMVARSLARSLETGPRWLFFRLPRAVNPAALMLMLMLGFAIGYSAFAPDVAGTDESFLQSYSDDEGTAL